MILKVFSNLNDSEEKVFGSYSKKTGTVSIPTLVTGTAVTPTPTTGTVATQTAVTGTAATPIPATGIAATPAQATGTAAEPGNQPVLLSIASIHRRKSWKRKSARLKREDERAGPSQGEEEEEEEFINEMVITQSLSLSKL
ncbi:hypothetical protein QYF61_011854 [Mycteria americana]|uniref:Uncharacterized protein n=1 Tax=Mycteria americana TaxID=33587 RepID=A0AAN7S9D2_MYCAM|nr:hypothetical protein QYF61_011854 [Mycteria americana]